MKFNLIHRPSYIIIILLFNLQVLYTRIAVGLWRSSKQLERHLNASESSQTLNNVNQCNLTAYTPASHLCNQTHRFKHQPLHPKVNLLFFIIPRISHVKLFKAHQTITSIYRQSRILYFTMLTKNSRSALSNIPYISYIGYPWQP